MSIFMISRPFHKPNIIIKTNCAEIIKQISSFYGKYASLVYTNDGMEMEIRRYHFIYEMIYNEEIIITASPLQEISRIAFQQTTFDDSVFALHAAAVEYKGKAHVFIASTTSGKTTLTAYLTMLGMGYITDDCVMLDKESLQLYPFCIPLHLRDGGIKVLDNYKIKIPQIELVEDNSLQRYVYTPQNCVNKLLEIAEIYFIERSKNQNLITDMTTSKAIEQLMKSPIIPYKISGEHIRLLSRIAAIGCKNLVYSDMNFVKQIIEEMK